MIGCLAYGYEPQEHCEKGNKQAQRVVTGVCAGPAHAFRKSNGVAILVQNKRGKFKRVFLSSVAYDTNVFPFKHCLQEVLTSRQYKPILKALKGTAELRLEYEHGEEDNVCQDAKHNVQADRHKLLGCKICMVVKGRTRFGKREWYGEIRDIIKDKTKPSNDAKTVCRIFGRGRTYQFKTRVKCLWRLSSRQSSWSAWIRICSTCR